MKRLTRIPALVFGSFIFGTLAVGVLATLGCLFSAAWVLMETEIAIIASILIISTM